jgi:hypothetical protein
MPLTLAQLEALPQASYTDLLEQLNEDYHNYEDESGVVTKEHGLSDRAYDFYVEVFERRFGPWTRVGAPAASAKRPWQRKVTKQQSSKAAKQQRNPPPSFPFPRPRTSLKVLCVHQLYLR